MVADNCLVRQVFGLTLVLSSACASNAAKEVDTAKNLADGEARSTSGTRGDAGAGCRHDRSAAEYALYKPGRKRLDGHKYKLFTSSSKKKRKSFCDYIIDSRAKVAIFQFAGVDCSSCMDEAEDITKFLSTHDRRDDIVHVVVLTDFFEDVRDSEFENFMDSYAPKSLRGHDEAKLWKFFSKKSSEPSRATILAMDIEMNAVVINQEGRSHQIQEEAVRLAKKLSEKDD